MQGAYIHAHVQYLGCMRSWAVIKIVISWSLPRYRQAENWSGPAHRSKWEMFQRIQKCGKENLGLLFNQNMKKVWSFWIIVLSRESILQAFSCHCSQKEVLWVSSLSLSALLHSIFSALIYSEFPGTALEMFHLLCRYAHSGFHYARVKGVKMFAQTLWERYKHHFYFWFKLCGVNFVL